MASLQGRFLKEVVMMHMDAPSEVIPEGFEIADGRTLAIGTHDIGGGVATYTLPDLRNRFILGADPTKAAGDAGTSGTAPTDAPGPKGVGGIHAKTLTTAELPSHTHTFTSDAGGSHTHTGTAASSGSHTHTASSNTSGSHSHSGSSLSTAGNHAHTQSWLGGFYGAPNGNVAAQDGNHSAWDTTNGQATGSAGDHTHTVTITADGSHGHTITVDAGGAHTHTLTVDASTTHTHTGTTAGTGSGTAFDMRPRYYGLVFLIKVKN